MKWTDPILIDGKEYRFHDTYGDPLIFAMPINDKYTLWRDINCDEPLETWTLVLTYDSVKNSVVTPNDKFRTQVYHGKDIQSPTFIKELLEHVLHRII